MRNAMYSAKKAIGIGEVGNLIKVRIYNTAARQKVKEKFNLKFLIFLNPHSFYAFPRNVPKIKAL